MGHSDLPRPLDLRQSRPAVRASSRVRPDARPDHELRRRASPSSGGVTTRSKPLPPRPVRRQGRPDHRRRDGDRPGDRRGPGGARGRHGDPEPQGRAPRRRRRGDRRRDGPRVPAARRRRPPARAVEAAVGRVVEEFGRLDIVVNAAAGNFFCPSADLSPNGFGTVLDIDAKGTWNVSPGRLPRLAEGPRRLDPQHQRDAPLRRHARPAPRRGGEGGRRRPDPHPGRRVGAARASASTRSPPARSATPRGPAASSPARPPSASRRSSPPAGSARSPTSSTSPSSSSATPARTSTARSSSPTAGSA